MNITDMPPTRCISPRELARYRRQYRRRPHLHTLAIVLTSIASAAVLLLTLGACGATGHAAPSKPARTLTVVPLPVQIKQWYAIAGKKLLAAVGTDEQAIAGDKVNSRAMKIDGQALQQDATIAAGNPPPGDARLYLSAMGAVQAAGSWFAEGNAAVGAQVEQRAAADLGKWTGVLASEMHPGAGEFPDSHPLLHPSS